MLLQRTTYGHYETPNQLSGETGRKWHEKHYDAPTVDWSARGLKITRFRILSDPGFPMWDISYCHGEINGQPVNVEFPFTQMPKRGWKKFLVNEGKKRGIFVKGLNIFDPLVVSALN